MGLTIIFCMRLIPVIIVIVSGLPVLYRGPRDLSGKGTIVGVDFLDLLTRALVNCPSSIDGVRVCFYSDIVAVTLRFAGLLGLGLGAGFGRLLQVRDPRCRDGLPEFDLEILIRSIEQRRDVTPQLARDPRAYRIHNARHGGEEIKKLSLHVRVISYTFNSVQGESALGIQIFLHTYLRR